MMPVKITQIRPGRCRVETPHGVKSYDTTRKKAEAQARLLEGIEHSNPMETKIPLDSIVADVPPLYKLLYLHMEHGIRLLPKVPLAIFPDGDMHSVFFKFFGLNSYDAHVAFPALRSSHGMIDTEILSIDYKIVVIGGTGPSVSAVYHHVFKRRTYMGLKGLRSTGGALISMHNALEHLPKLPNGWQYMQFIG
jgi:hypothetical protein